MPRRGRATAVIALGALVALAVGGCVPTTEQASPTPTLAPTTMPSPNPYTGATPGSGAGVSIGYISPGDSVPFIKAVSDGIAAEAQTAGATLVPCDAEFNDGKVMDCLGQLGKAGVKGIIAFVLPGSKTAADICGAIAQGVPVVAIEFALDPCAKTVVGADDLRAGQVAGRAVGQWVKAQWSCSFDALIGLTSSNAADRSNLRVTGFRQGFEESCKDDAFQSGVADTVSTASQAIDAFLGSNAGDRHILVFGINDDAILGTLQAVTAAGRTGDVWVAGQGAGADVRDLIRNNPQYLGDSAYFPERYGTSAVPALLDLIAGKSVPPSLLIEPQWVDKSNIAQVYPN